MQRLRSDDIDWDKGLKTAGILVCVGLPVVLVYLVFVSVAGWLDLPLLFLAFFVPAFLVSVSFDHLFTCLLSDLVVSIVDHCIPLPSRLLNSPTLATRL